MIIDCISDLHGATPNLPGGDVLIVAGDLTGRDDFAGWFNFMRWISQQDYKKKAWIGGNHDQRLQDEGYAEDERRLEFKSTGTYLQDSGTEYEGLKIWGSPWTLRFRGQNPQCMAFSVDTEEELQEKWSQIPSATDILITHMPPEGILDTVKDGRVDKLGNATWRTRRTGSKTLRKEVLERIKPRFHIFGHIHQGHGTKDVKGHDTVFMNVAHMDEHYNPVNGYQRISL